jgi:CheY-like chemotaxis protein
MAENKLLLYFEDDPLSRDIMKVMVKNLVADSELIIFEDSYAFMQRLNALPKRPSAILMDIHLQPHDGFQLLDMLRTDVDWQEMRVIALTASVMNEEVEKLKRSGFDAAISKPLDARVFPSLLARILEGQSVWHIS